MAMTSEILSNTSARLGIRVVAKHVENSVDFGPFVLHLPTGTDVDAYLASHRTAFEASLKQAEINANIAKALNGETETSTFVRSTGNENLAAMRAQIAVSTKWELMVLGYVIQEFGLTDNQLKSLFGVNDAQLPALKTKLTTIHARYLASIAEVPF